MRTLTPRRRRRLLRLARTILVTALLVTLAITRPWRPDDPAGPDGLLENGEPSDAGSPPLALDIGSCFDLGAGEDIRSVVIVDCRGSHGGEVFHVTRLPDGDPPDADRLGAIAEADCAAAFEGYVGRSREESILDFSYFAPTPETWAAGDRGIVCWLRAGDAGPMVGPMRGLGA